MGDATAADEKILGGFLILARSIEDSELWQQKPAEWCKVWIHILLNVNFSLNPKNNLPRGSGHFDWATAQSKLHGVSADQYQRCIAWLREKQQIETTRTVRGLIIKVLNYEQYQNPTNYSGASVSQKKRNKFSQANLTLPNEPPPAPAKPKPSATWVIPYIELWRNIFHADPAAGHLMKYLGPLHQQHGQEKTLLHLENYLKTVNAQHINLARFAQTFGSWATIQKAGQKQQPKADYREGWN